MHLKLGMTRSTPIALLTTAVIAGSLVFGCDGGEPQTDLALDAQRSAIVNGTVDDGHHAVGVLRNSAGNACTATLIGERTVLTAGHCVSSATPPYELHAPVDFYLGGVNGSRFTASAIVRHPDYAGANAADLAVVRLSRAVAGVTPATITRLPVRLGEAVELVGFGKTSETSSDFGIKHKAQNVIGRLSDELYTVYGGSGEQGNICNGDSGGPTFATRGGQEVLVGVHSTKGGSCGQEGYDIRTDFYYDWILEAAQGDVATASDRDTAAPQVAIASPTTGSRVASRFTVTVEASDDQAVVWVQLLVNGQVVDERTHAPFTFLVDDRTDGAYALEVVVYDGAGQSATARVDVTVDSSIAPALDGAAGALPFGATCTLADDCDSRLCVAGPAGSVCTSQCTTADECPMGSRCASGICLAGSPASPAQPGSALDPEGLTGSEAGAAGGCSMGGTSANAQGLWLLLLALPLLARRRRAR